MLAERASQLVTHALLRDAGFTLQPDAAAWEDVSVEQAYDRLPEPQDGPGEDGASDAPPSHDPPGTGEVMDADARARDGGDSAEAPVDITAEE